jgi:hypothetical protein
MGLVHVMWVITVSSLFFLIVISSACLANNPNHLNSHLDLFYPHDLLQHKKWNENGRN